MHHREAIKNLMLGKDLSTISLKARQRRAPREGTSAGGGGVVSEKHRDVCGRGGSHSDLGGLFWVGGG